MQLNNYTSKHGKEQKESERRAIETLTPSIRDALSQDNTESYEIEETESPDFVFRSRETTIGIEVVECHPSIKKGKDNAPALKSFKDKVCESFLDNLYLKSITKGINNKLRIIIDYDNSLSIKYDIYSICASIEYYLIAYHEGKKVRRGRVIRGIRVSKTRGQNIIQFNDIGRIDAIQCSSLCECVAKKNELFDAYKSKNSCSEYWLCIFLPYEEYKHSYRINYDIPRHRLDKLLKRSKFSRICVTSCLHNDLRWLKGNPQPIKHQTKTKKITKRKLKSLNLKSLRKLRKLYFIC